MTAHEVTAADPNLAPLRTREDVKRYVALRVAGSESRHTKTERTRQVVRHATLLFGFCFSVLQYYFFYVGVEILSMPSITVLIGAVRVG